MSPSFNNYIHSSTISITEISLETEPGQPLETAEFESFKYKKVANHVNPVSAALPESFCIVRTSPPDILADVPSIPEHPPEFTPSDCYTTERKEKMGINKEGLLWPEEEKLVHWLFRVCEMGFAWDKSEKGMFLEEYLKPVRIPTLGHDVWIFKNIPIPRGLFPQIIEILKAKIAAGVIELSNAAYRSQWFWVLKEDKKSLRIVHNLQPLNAVTIKDSAIPPIVEPYAESFAGRACYTVLDLFVRFDQQTLHPDSRDLTTFQTPLGTFRLTRIPMGYTNSQQVQHGDLCFILQDEIPHVAMPYIDDVPIAGGISQYELPDSRFEVTPANPGVRRFVYEHLRDVLRVVWKVMKFGGTFSGPKAVICVPKAIIVGHLCTYKGRRVLPDRVQKIIDWPIPRNLSDVRGFLSTLGTLQMFIKDYAAHLEPLVKLTRRKKVDTFDFGLSELEAMEKLKILVSKCPAIRPIDYESDGEVTLAVDSSNVAMGYILSQEGQDGLRYPSHFGSITWNEVEHRYSQAKIELFRLFRALKDVRTYTIAVKRLVVEVDARYIKGMINNPDIQPNTTINRWIAGILLFDFKLCHVPANKHIAADGLSRREHSPNDPDPDEDYDEWIDTANAFAIQVLNSRRLNLNLLRPETSSVASEAYVYRLLSPSLILSPLAAEAPSRLSSSSPALSRLSLLSPVSPRISSSRLLPSSSLLLASIKASSLRLQSLPQASFAATGTGEAIPRSDMAHKKDALVEKVDEYLRTLRRPQKVSDAELAKFTHYALDFFVAGGKLYCRDRRLRHQLVVPLAQQASLLKQAHEELGHKGVFTVTQRLLSRFWWPAIHDDVKWWVRLCHECQIRNTTRVHILPMVPTPFSLFRKIYTDTMFLPHSHSYNCIVHTRCSLSSYPEWRMLRSENARSLAAFLFEDILCRYGMVEELVTDNGPPYVAVVKHLKERYDILDIKISPYNLQANGPVERRHYDVREALMKATEGDESRWPLVTPSVFWAERVRVQPIRLGLGIRA